MRPSMSDFASVEQLTARIVSETDAMCPPPKRLHHFTTDSNADEFSDLRRAVGARRCDIRNQFLLEAALLAGFGGLIGVGIGTGAAWTVAALG